MLLEVFWSNMHVSVERLESLEAVVLTSGEVRATVLPGLGAKIISVIDRRADRELVWRDPSRSLADLPADALYSDGDASGIDDCFPTVDACELDGAISLQDHGYVWSRPWSWSHHDNAVDFAIEGSFGPVARSFKLRRTISIDGARLRLDYILINTGDDDLTYQWTGHPLFQAVPGMQILLPDNPDMRTGFAMGGRVDLSRPSWRWPMLPTVDGVAVDAGEVLSWSAGLNEKYWAAGSPKPCRLRYPESDEELVIDYDRSGLDAIAICVNYGGWPSQNPGYWVAVEPSTSPHDALTTTCASGNGRILRPGEAHSWWWSLGVERAASNPEGA